MTNLKRAIKTGCAVGLIGAGVTISAMITEMFRHDYDIEKTKSNLGRIVQISGDFPIDAAKKVYTAEYTASTREQALYTYYLSTCVALIIDDARGNKQCLWHVAPAKSKRELAKEITAEFPRREDVGVYLREGENSSLLTRKVYGVLKTLGLENKLKFITGGEESSAKSVLISGGKFYRPSE